MNTKDRIATLKRNKMFVNIICFGVTLSSGTMFNYHHWSVNHHYPPLQSTIAVIVIAMLGYYSMNIITEAVNAIRSSNDNAGSSKSVYYFTLVASTITAFSYICYESYTSNSSIKKTEYNHNLEDSDYIKSLRKQLEDAELRVEESRIAMNNNREATDILINKGIVTATVGLIGELNKNMNDAQDRASKLSLKLQNAIEEHRQNNKNSISNFFDFMDEFPSMPFVFCAMIFMIGSSFYNARLNQITSLNSSESITEHHLSDDFDEGIRQYVENGKPESITQDDLAKKYNQSQSTISRKISKIEK